MTAFGAVNTNLPSQSLCLNQHHFLYTGRVHLQCAQTNRRVHVKAEDLYYDSGVVKKDLKEGGMFLVTLEGKCYK